jgi:hypothetical protein
MRFSRDVLNALGAGARFEFAGGVAVDSSIPIENIRRLEALIDELRPPAWPGTIDGDRAARGQQLYQRDCAGCHDGERDGAVLVQTLVDVTEVGTDGAYADAINDRTIASTGTTGLPTGRLAIELTADIAGAVIELELTRLGVDDAGQSAFTEGRPNQWRAVAAYKALPLAGIWATPPYLHNGSVPSLYELLLPAGARSAEFELAALPDYDPVRVGVSVDQPGAGVFVFDTRVPGNTNTGHEYGVADYDEEDRIALIEYLKTL